MATLVLTTVGTLIGGPVGGALGAVLGQAVDQRLFAPRPRQGPRLGDLSVQTSSYGSAIPKIFGIMRVAGTVIWSTDLIERRMTSGGGKGHPGTVDYSYSASFAVALSARRVSEVRRIWADGKLVRGAAGDWKAKTKFRLHSGDEDQLPDPLIEAAEGAGQAPAYRGLAYAVFEELELADFGNRIPSLSFEVIADSAPVGIAAIADALSDGALAAGDTPALAGFAASGDSVRGAIQDLAEVVPLSLADDGARLILRLPSEPGEPIDRVEEAGRREVVRRGAATLPREVTVTYYDAARDYQAGLQRARNVESIECRHEQRALPAVLDAGAAKAIAERRLQSLAIGRASATVTLGWSRADLRPGALVRLAGEGGLWRIERLTIGSMTVRLELVRWSGGAATLLSATPGRLLEQLDLPHGPTVVRMVELPSGEGVAEKSVVAVLAAGTQPGWRRAFLSLSLDGGVSWNDIGGTAAPAILGSAATVLPGAGSSLFDRANRIDVELLNNEMELLSRDEDALVAGANLALLGEELIQFGQAERIGEKTYRLSRLLRGRRGTEWAASAHVIGEDFALIEPGSLRMIDIPQGVGVGATLTLLATGMGDEEPVAAAVVIEEEALRPPSPVHLAAAAAAGRIAISWVRRSRQGWAWASGADTPLTEERELYRLTFGGLRSIETATPAYFYSAAERASDGPAPVLVEVVQLGTHAPSRPAAIIIP